MMICLKTADLLEKTILMNYLNASRLNRLVTMFIDYAELMAEDGILMSMQDWVDQTNQFLLNNRRKVLNGKGKISHDVAMQKAAIAAAPASSATFAISGALIQVSSNPLRIFIVTGFLIALAVLYTIS